MYHVYLLFTFSEPSKPFYVGQTTRLIRRLNEHTSSTINEKKTKVLIDEAERGGGFIMRTIAITYDIQQTLMVESLFMYLLREQITNGNTSIALVESTYNDCVKGRNPPYSLTDVGKLWCSEIFSSGLPFDILLLEQLLAFASRDIAPSWNRRKKIDRHRINYDHPIVKQVMGSML